MDDSRSPIVILMFEVSEKGKMRIRAQAQVYGSRDMITVRQIAREFMSIVAVPVRELYDR